MGILFPGEAIGHRWNGALQARLRGALLERFLASRGIASAPPKPGQNGDNLVRATMCFIEAGLLLYSREQWCGPAEDQLAGLGHVVCLVSRAVAEVISEPAAWRAGALVSIARILSASMGLNAAAIASAVLVRNFDESTAAVSAADMRVTKSVTAAITGDSADGTQLAVDIATSLAHAQENVRPPGKGLLTRTASV